MKRTPLLAALTVTVTFGCHLEEALISPDMSRAEAVPPDPVSAVSRDSADAPSPDSPSTDEQCDLIEIELHGGQRTEVYICQQPRGGGSDANADAATDGTTICWYWVTEIRIGGILVSRTEEFLFCEEPTDTGGCDDEQRTMAQEYDDYDVQHREHPSCSEIEYKGAGTANFSWEELNGYFQEGNPHTGYGWVQLELKSGIQGMRDAYGGPLPLSSGYRCPHGNASIPSASPTSWHLEGRAVDISVKSMADVQNNWTQMTAAERQRVTVIWLELDELARMEGATDLQGFGEYPDRHYHAAW